jgi:hypothetical protein
VPASDTEGELTSRERDHREGESARRGTWTDSTFEDRVQYHDGFPMQLIGTRDQIAKRIAA